MRRYLIYQSLIVGVLALIPFSELACGQGADSSVSKATALKGLKIQATEGWQESNSDEWRFRVLFPGPGILEQDRGPMKGFRFVGPDANWFVYASDFDLPRSSDDQDLRPAYRGSAEALTKNGSQLLNQSDVFLHGRLGTQIVLQGSGTISYMRAFLFERTMYTLAVDRKRTANGDATIPSDVQKFFDSFTYWDVP